MSHTGRRVPGWPSALLLTTLAPVLAAAPPVHANPGTQTARTAVAKLEQRWLAAIAPGGDRLDLQGILADDYVDIDWQGQVRDKADLIGAVTKPGTHQHVTGLHIRVWGNTAVATGTNEVHSTTRGWTVTVPFTDVFARVDGQWRAVSSQETLRHGNPKPPASANPASSG